MSRQLQDNDEVHGRILTEGEYRMGVTHSQWITEPGSFVALPGYEWTQRTSKQGVPDPFGSAFEQNIPKLGCSKNRRIACDLMGLCCNINPVKVPISLKPRNEFIYFCIITRQ